MTGDRLAQQVHPLAPEADQLAPAQPSVGGGEDEGSVPGPDGVGEINDLPCREEAHLDGRDRWGRHPIARVDGDELILHRHLQ